MVQDQRQYIIIIIIQFSDDNKMYIKLVLRIQ